MISNSYLDYTKDFKTCKISIGFSDDFAAFDFTQKSSVKSCHDFHPPLRFAPDSNVL